VGFWALLKSPKAPSPVLFVDLGRDPAKLLSDGYVRGKIFCLLEGL